MKKINNISNNYEDLPLSEDTFNGMTMNVYDQQFLKRAWDRQDEINEELINSFTKNILAQFNNKIDEIGLSIKNLSAEIKDIKADIKLLHVIAEKNQNDIRLINGDIQQMKRDIEEERKMVNKLLELHPEIKLKPRRT
jgi:chromosome segregation ATPase